MATPFLAVTCTLPWPRWRNDVTPSTSRVNLGCLRLTSTRQQQNREQAALVQGGGRSEPLFLLYGDRRKTRRRRSLGSGGRGRGWGRRGWGDARGEGGPLCGGSPVQRRVSAQLHSGRDYLEETTVHFTAVHRHQCDILVSLPCRSELFPIKIPPMNRYPAGSGAAAAQVCVVQDRLIFISLFIYLFICLSVLLMHCSWNV